MAWQVQKQTYQTRDTACGFSLFERKLSVGVHAVGRLDRIQRVGFFLQI